MVAERGAKVLPLCALNQTRPRGGAKADLLVLLPVGYWCSDNTVLGGRARAALEGDLAHSDAAGVEFTNGDQPGVRMRKVLPARPHSWSKIPIWNIDPRGPN